MNDFSSATQSPERAPVWLWATVLSIGVLAALASLQLRESRRSLVEEARWGLPEVEPPLDAPSRDLTRVLPENRSLGEES